MLLSGKKSVKLFTAAALFIVSMGSASQLLYAQPVMQDKAEVSIQARVNINQADAATIADVLDGVGESKARAIIEYRERHGPFTSLEELSEVKGIGQSTLNANRDRITLE